MSFSPVKSVLGKVLRRWKIGASDLEAYRIFSIWENIVGEKLALHTKPIKVSERRLHVEVDDPLWLAQVKYMKKVILEKIDETVKPGVIRDIRFYLKGFS